MAIDPAFGMPYENFQQTGSFVKPVSPPIDGPFDGTLVALPCINPAWLRLLLGAATQLLNPSSWDPALSDAARVLVLQRATDLMGGLAALDTCVNPVVGASLDGCILNLHLADGSTVPVTNWAADFAGCVQDAIPPVVPGNPRGDPTAQHACNIAGYLAQKIIEVTMQKVVSYVGTTNDQVAFAREAWQAIAFAFPITNAVQNALYTFYQNAVGQILSQVEFVSTDATLWSDVTCAIYEAIVTTGYVTAANFATASANLHGIVYPYFWAVNAIANYWDELGIDQIRQFQVVGAIDDVDCTSCAEAFCKEFDVRLNMQGYSASGGLSPTWVSGLGWVGAYESGPNVTRLWISQPASYWGGLVTVNQVAVSYSQSGAGDGSNENHTPHINLFNGGTVVKTINLPLGPASGAKQIFSVSPAVLADSFDFYVLSEGHVSNPVLVYSEISGTTTGTFSGSTCAD